MDSEALQGESRPPKFMICHYCSAKGHRASQCPTKGACGDTYTVPHLSHGAVSYLVTLHILYYPTEKDSAQQKVKNKELQGQNVKSKQSF